MNGDPFCQRNYFVFVFREYNGGVPFKILLGNVAAIDAELEAAVIQFTAVDVRRVITPVYEYSALWPNKKAGNAAWNRKFLDVLSK
jgi:hypothetical protein